MSRFSRDCLTQFSMVTVVAITAFSWLTLPASAGELKAAKAVQSVDFENPHDVAHLVDHMIATELQNQGTQATSQSLDEDFLRRVAFDLTGHLPSPNNVTLFGIDSDPEKRARVIDELLASEGYSNNWARYWRDVIFSRATDERSRRWQNVFEEWMSQQLSENRASAVLTFISENFQDLEIDLFSVRGFGESQPIATNDIPEGRQENRRVVFREVE